MNRYSFQLSSVEKCRKYQYNLGAGKNMSSLCECLQYEKVVNKHIFLYLSATPQHAVVDNSEMFLRLERIMIKTIDVVSTIPTPLTMQEKKNSGGSIMPYESVDTSPDTQQSQSRCF